MAWVTSKPTKRYRAAPCSVRIAASEFGDFTIATPAASAGVIRVPAVTVTCSARTTIQPVPVGFFGNTCHAIDIGGIGLSANGHEVYEEGLQIPIAKLYTASGPNETLLEMIAANVRAPREVLGDLHAQVAGNQVGADRLIAYLVEFGLDDLTGIGDEILRRSEVAMRAAIAALPDGEYSKTCITDGDLDPITVRVTLRVAGDSVVADFAGSSAQSDRGLNVVLNYTAAYTNYALKCALAPAVPNNEGSFRPVSVVAPQGYLQPALSRRGRGAADRRPLHSPCRLRRVSTDPPRSPDR